MKIKFIYQNGPFYYEAECLNEQERKEAIKGLVYATKDLVEGKLLGMIETFEDEPVCDEKRVILEQPMEKVEVREELATEGQRKYMTKLGIRYTDETTKIQAIDLINNYKIAHNIPVGQNKKF